MSEFDGLWKHEKTQHAFLLLLLFFCFQLLLHCILIDPSKDPVIRVRKPTQISHGKNSHWDNNNNKNANKIVSCDGMHSSREAPQTQQPSHKRTTEQIAKYKCPTPEPPRNSTPSPTAIRLWNSLPPVACIVDLPCAVTPCLVFDRRHTCSPEDETNWNVLCSQLRHVPCAIPPCLQACPSPFPPLDNLTDYQLNSTILQRVTSNAYLEIRISEDLKWGPHISGITKKANSTFGFVRRNLRRCPPACRNTAYLALISPTPSGVRRCRVRPLSEKGHRPDGAHSSSPATTGPRPPAVSPDSSRRPSYSLCKSAADNSA